MSTIYWIAGIILALIIGPHLIAIGYDLLRRRKEPFIRGEELDLMS